eukprot:12414561-Karenia_brevis.AAC.1
MPLHRPNLRMCRTICTMMQAVTSPPLQMIRYVLTETEHTSELEYRRSSASSRECHRSRGSYVY